MRSRFRLRSPWTSPAVVAAALSILTFSARAAAGNCTSDSECAHGYTCQTTSIGGCPPCAPGLTCPACDPAITKSCELAPCTTDGDCAANAVCHTDTFSVGACTAMASPACGPGQTCPAVDASPVDAAPVCTTTTMSVSTCTLKYNLPCTADADCGDGFTCVPDTTITCSGAGGYADAGVAVAVDGDVTTGVATSGSPPTGVANSGSPPAVGANGSGSGGAPVEPDPQPSCTSTTLPTSHCEAKVIACTADADCPSTWTCVAAPPAANVPRPLGGGTACPIRYVDGAVSLEYPEDAAPAARSPAPLPPEDAGVAQDADPAPDAATSSGQCVPPNYAPRGASHGAAEGDAAVGSSVPATPQTGGAGNNTAGDAGNVTGSGAPSGTPSSNAGNGATAGSKGKDDIGGGGLFCQFGVAPAGVGNGAWFSLLTLLGFGLRRRQPKRAP